MRSPEKPRAIPGRVRHSCPPGPVWKPSSLHIRKKQRLARPSLDPQEQRPRPLGLTRSVWSPSLNGTGAGQASHWRGPTRCWERSSRSTSRCRRWRKTRRPVSWTTKPSSSQPSLSTRTRREQHSEFVRYRRLHTRLLQHILRAL